MNVHSRDGQAVFAGLAEAAARVSEAVEAFVYREDGGQLRLVAGHGTRRATRVGGKAGPPARSTIQGRAFLDRTTIRNGAQIAAPILVNGTAVGAIVARRTGARPFSPAQAGRLEAFAAHAAIVIQDIAARDRELAEALAQQTATAEIIRAISGSTDMRRVFDMIAEGAVRLCHGQFGGVFQFDGRLIHLLAQHGLSSDGADVYARTFPRPQGRESAIGRALLDRAIVHIADVGKDPEYGLTALAVAGAMRCIVAVPVLREGHPIGGIVAWRSEPEPFSDRQIELLKTFADQTLIAIENVRLFTELEAKNRNLTESLEQQTATAEILRAISGSPTDIQPVLDTVVRAAARFCGAEDVVLLRLDGTVLRGAAGLGQVHDAAVRQLGRLAALEVPVTRGSVTGRAVIERRAVHVHDLTAEPDDEFPEGRELARRFRHRTTMAAPLLREGTPLGAIALFRRVVDPFSDKQLELLRTFADQAVIAIENVRLFTELEARNKDLTETLEQQTATGEILRVISSSPTDVQPVFDTIAESAARLCEARDAVVYLADGKALRPVARHGPVMAGPVPLVTETVGGRTVIERRTVHVADLQAEVVEFPVGAAISRQEGTRSMLSVPLLHEDRAIGTIALRRFEVRPFSDAHVKLLQTFAAQAVIAIENVRLFKELEAKNRDLTETLEQQTATSEILRVISTSPTDVQPVFDTIVRSAVLLCGAGYGTAARYDGELIHLVAGYNHTPEVALALRRVFPTPPTPLTMSGRAILAGDVVQVEDALEDPDYAENVARAGGFRSMLAAPMLRDGRPIGAIVVNRGQPGPFSRSQVELLKTFAAQAVIAIENVRLFKELEAKNRDLTETLEQQTATSEILRVISSSPTDVQPVFDTIARSAARLCEAVDAVIWQRDGDRLRVVASYGGLPIARRELTIGRHSVGGRAVIDCRAVHVEDLAAVFEEEFPDSRGMKELGYRTILAMPLVREGKAIGIILIRRTDVRPFSDGQVALLGTFADQAVIAIENVRLFKELETRNHDLIETLEQQTATGEILRVISSSPTDVQPVFDTIARSAKQLCGAQFCQLYRFDGQLLHFVAHHGLSPEGAEAVRRAYPVAPGRVSAAARSVLSGRIEHIPDVDADPEYGQGRVARTVNFRSVVAVPMVRDGVPIGSIAVARVEAGSFPERQLDLLKTFADQAVIAIENVRLFTELEAKNHDLTETLEQQTATSEILRVISSSPTDVQPVFDTIARSALRLCDAIWSAVTRFDGTLIDLASHHGLGDAAALEAVRRAFPRRPSPHGATDRAIVGRVVGHYPDVLEDPDYGFQDMARAAGYRSMLAVPMVREGQAVGAITVAGATARTFSDRQIDLLKTFADQAVIAIENVRLFKELEAKNHDLTETLEQQTATGEILRVISSSPTDVQPVFDIIGERAERLCAAAISVVSRFDGELLHLVSLNGVAADGVEPIRSAFPMRPDDETISARAVRTRDVVHVADVLDDIRYEQKGAARAGGYRGCLAVPMLRDGHVAGVIFVARTRPGLFSDTQVELLKTFADQAVIAVENVRLFTELDARNRDLTETLEQQTATGEILRVISSSPTNVQPVFDAIVEAAMRLCGAASGILTTFDGQMMHLSAQAQIRPEGTEVFRRVYPRHPSRGFASGRVVLTRAIVHITDVLEDSEYEHRDLAHAAVFRGVLAVPMLRDGVPIGTINVHKVEPARFTDKQVELLKTFADQAVIAIENVRLFTELEARNKALTETLEQQTATSEILRVISSSPTDVQPVFDTIARSAAQLCGAHFCHLFRFDGERLHFVAHHGLTPEGVEAMNHAFPMAPTRGTASGRATLSAAVAHLPDVLADPDYQYGALAKIATYRSLVAVPMLREGLAIGTINVARLEAGPFSDRQIDLLKTFADQAVIAIENVRLFTELEARNAELTGTLARQTATGEVLRAISRAQTDAQPVFDIIAASALRLCSGGHSGVWLYDGKQIHLAALENVTPEGAEAIRRDFPRPADERSTVGRAILARTVAQIPDVQEDPAYGLKGEARTAGFRSFLATPMLRDGEPIGVIGVGRPEPGPFPETQVELLRTFADQAVIAIENVRLFTELEARTGELTRSVGELKALGEVSQAVSSTLELETVLETIVTRAVELSDAAGGAIYGFDEATEEFRLQASHRMEEELLATLRASPLRLGEGTTGQAALRREPVEVADIADPSQYGATRIRAVLVELGYHSLLSVPLLQDQRLLGALTIWRRVAGRFPEEVVNLLRTLATQSSLAIHNAGLFREIQRRKQYADAIVDTSPVAIVTVDLASRVVGWNPGAERLFGYTEAEALGRPMEDLVATPETREELRVNIRRTLAGESIRAIGRRARKDGTPVDVEISSVPVVVDGVEMGMIGIYHDITDLLRARREAEAANEAKSAFLATMSHEIRTPMNAVIGMSGLLLNTELTDEQREYAEVVRQSGDALLTVINDILDFSKIEAGKLELESQPFDLRECVEGALDLVATRAAEKSLDLAYLLADGTPPAVVGDVTRLRQVLLNLLSNAVKFTERGEIVLSVSARRPDPGGSLHELTFSVRDTGIGIPPDRVDRLFQSFSQVDASTTRRYGGTGLGLAISQRLTELMGGRIGVTSEVGVGSEFRFTIRAAAAQAPASARRDLTGVQPGLRDKRVLVVDDNATNRRILAAHLDAWGMPMRATGSPGEALEWIRAGERFDIGILDMHMPEMDGVALARAIREHPVGPGMPLVLFTSLGRREARAEEEGFAAYLHKPIKPSQLFDALISVLGDQPVHVRERGVARRELDPEMGRRHPLRILLAEDNVVNQKVALRLLGQMGYRADVASNGLEAVDAVERQTYDVVLMDVQMPELDGFEASREINRRWPGERRPRIVAMTANAMQGDRELCVAAGMDDYVAKPIRVEELVTALERTPRRTDGAPGGPATSRPTDRAGVGAGPAEAGARAGSRDPAPTAPAPPAGAIDGATFDTLTRSMGEAFVAELIDTFVEDAQELTAQLPTALERGDVDGFRRAAHSLKSTSESLGAMDLAALARELETIARTGSLAGVGERLGRVADEYARAAHALRKLRRDLSA
jgi:PAS domain S-box-containing protein